MADNTLKNLKYDTHGEITLAGSSNTYTGSTADPSALRGYFKGLRICAEANHDNTGAATLNLNSIGAGDIKVADGSDPESGAIQDGGIYDFVHDGTNWMLLNPTDTGVAAGSVDTTELADEAVTYAKMQHVSATSRVLGRKTAGAGDVEECTLSEVLDFVGSAAQGDILYRNASAWVRLPAGTSGEFLQTQGAAANLQWAEADAGLTAETAQATTSGTAFDFTIPAGANRITVIFDQVSLSGSDVVLVQLGDSGGIEATGYSSSAGNRGATATNTTGLLVNRGGNAAYSYSGNMLLCRVNGNAWVSSHTLETQGAEEMNMGAGRKALSAELTTVRVTRSGSNTFDAGQVNIFVE